MRDNGCGLHNDGKFWDCRTSGQFPNWNFVRLGSLVVKCPGCCTGVMGSIPGPDTCDRQHLGQELHWWHYSHKCVGLVCPQLHSYLYQINKQNLNCNTFRKDDTPKLELIHIARLDTNMSRFFYQKKQFTMPQYVPSSLTGVTWYLDTLLVVIRLYSGQAMCCMGSRRWLSGTQSQTPRCQWTSRGGGRATPSTWCSHITGSYHPTIVIRE